MSRRSFEKASPCRRLKPGGGGANAAIFSAAGPELEVETKKRAGSLIPGKALVVPLPSTSPLFSREGVTHVIHVLGPNMNRQRPNCLNNDYVKGSKVLREAYTSLFEGFASIMNTQGNLLEGSSENLRSELSVSQDHFKGNHIKNVPNHDQKIKRVGVYESETSKKCKGFQDEHEFDCTESKEGKDNLNNEKIGRNMTKTWGSWAQSLYHIAMHPEKHKDNLIEISDDVVVLNDLYPKVNKTFIFLFLFLFLFAIKVGFQRNGNSFPLCRHKDTFWFWPDLKVSIVWQMLVENTFSY